MALLGFGQVGSAVAQIAHGPSCAIRVAGALVRDLTRPRPRWTDVELTRDAERLFALAPDVVVEVLGGIEPARTLIRSALERRVPVVTANKALLAHHGEELLDLAVRTGTPLRYEASVLAGVPFLGTFGARPLASRVSRLIGILNGTSNFVASRVSATGSSVMDAVAEAQRLGLAEPDPADDVDGIDATHKLAVLAWHFGLGTMAPARVETSGIGELEPGDFAAAAEFGGAIKPIASVEQTGPSTTAFAGPAFLARTHRLASIDGVENALILDTEAGRLFFSGPGAGPVPTAISILDDVVEAARGAPPIERRTRGRVLVSAPSTGWLLRIRAEALPAEEEIAAFLGSHGIWSQRVLTRDNATWRLTYPCEPERMQAALRALSLAARCNTRALRALED